MQLQQWQNRLIKPGFEKLFRFINSAPARPPQEKPGTLRSWKGGEKGELPDWVRLKSAINKPSADGNVVWDESCPKSPQLAGKIGKESSNTAKIRGKGEDDTCLCSLTLAVYLYTHT